MSPNVKVALAAAVTLLGATAVAGMAEACSCVRQPSAAAQLAQSDLAFRGRAITTRLTPDGNAAQTRFTVSELWRGRAGRTVWVRHGTGSSASCGIQFRAGQTVTVFAHNGETGPSTNLCSRAQFPDAAYRRAARRR